MQALPIFMNITNRLCVVIGGGEVATRKVTMLLKANAAITLYSPELCHELQDLTNAGKITYVKARFEQSQLANACMVVAATNDEPVNIAVSIAAKAQNIMLPYSCEAGRCGSCAARCTSGKVWMAYNEVLTDDEIAKDRVLVCQAYPVGGDVVIEYE